MDMALGTPRASSLFQDWYDTYVKPKKVASTFPTDSSLALPESPTPTPEAPVTSPAETNPSPTWDEKINAGLQNPAKMGLLTAGLSMMATPPRTVPYSNTEIIGRSGLAGVDAYEKALESKRRDEMMKQAAEEHTLAREDQSLYRRGMLEDRAAQRKIQEQNAASLEAQRKAAETLTGSLNAPVSDAYLTSIGRQDLAGQGITYAQLRAGSAPLNADLRSQGQLTPVQRDGKTVWERRSDAPGQEVAPKPTQKYKNVPGVGMVDISGPEPVVKIKAPVFGKSGGVGGKPTANIQNIEYLVGNGWNRKDAEDVVLHGKRMPRENFIAGMTKSIYGNEFIEDADKPKKMEEAIKFYDSTIPQRGGAKKLPTAGPTATETKVINGVTYYKRNGKWFDK